MATNDKISIRVTDATLIGGNQAAVGSLHTLEQGEALLVLGAGRAVRVSAEDLAELAKQQPATEHEQAAAKPAVEKAARGRKTEKASAKPEPELAAQ